MQSWTKFLGFGYKHKSLVRFTKVHGSPGKLEMGLCEQKLNARQLRAIKQCSGVKLWVRRQQIKGQFQRRGGDSSHGRAELWDSLLQHGVESNCLQGFSRQWDKFMENKSLWGLELKWIPPACEALDFSSFRERTESKDCENNRAIPCPEPIVHTRIQRCRSIYELKFYWNKAV